MNDEACSQTSVKKQQTISNRPLAHYTEVDVFGHTHVVRCLSLPSVYRTLGDNTLDHRPISHFTDVVESFQGVSITPNVLFDVRLRCFRHCTCVRPLIKRPTNTIVRHVIVRRNVHVTSIERPFTDTRGREFSLFQTFLSKLCILRLTIFSTTFTPTKNNNNDIGRRVFGFKNTEYIDRERDTQREREKKYVHNERRRKE